MRLIAANHLAMSPLLAGGQIGGPFELSRMGDKAMRLGVVF